MPSQFEGGVPNFENRTLFCGCATTCVAAEQLERQWVGIDIWDAAYQTVLDRLQDEWLFTPEDSKKVMFPHEVHYTMDLPVRTDGREIAAASLRLKIQRPEAPWQKMAHKEMVRVLRAAQKSDKGIICAGCGRVLEVDSMQLDHITPKSDRGENHIINRILLCGPCNRNKRDNLTLRGLLRQNKKVRWMRNESLAKLAQEAAREQAEWVRDNFQTQECRDLIAGKIENLL